MHWICVYTCSIWTMLIYNVIQLGQCLYTMWYNEVDKWPQLNNTLLILRACSRVGHEQAVNYNYIEVDDATASLKSLLHTLFHILGRYHEHQRNDQEEHVRIIIDNVIEGKYYSEI